MATPRGTSRSAPAIRNALAVLVLGLTGALAVPTAAAQVRSGDNDLLRALQAGGQVIVLRHATADPDRADTDPLNFRNVRTQQPLTEKGKQAARAMGEAWRRLGINFADVMTSRFNRAYQTAVLAGYKNARPMTELTEGSLVVSPNEQKRRAAFLRQATVMPLPVGSNRLIVTHRANIAQAFGREWYDVKEGEASVFHVENGAYSLLGRLQPEDWNRLLLLLAKKA